MKKFFKKALLLLPILFFSTAAKAPEKGPEEITLDADNTVVMDMEYTPTTVAQVMLKVQDMDSKLPFWKPIYLVVNSPGGSIEAGLELIDNLNGIGREIKTVTLFSASMAFQNVQGVPGTRYITPTGTLMAHKARGQFGGEFPGQLDSRYQYYLRRLGKLDETTVARSKGHYTLATWQQAYENEHWCEGQDCVDQGLADQVAVVKCGKSLRGTVTAKMEVSFLGMPIQVMAKKAACPTITGALEVKASSGNIVLPLNNIEEISKRLHLSYRDASELNNLLGQTVETLNPPKEAIND